MKKIFIFIALTAAFIAVVGILTKKSQNNELNLNLAKPSENLKEITIGTTKLNIEIADSQDERYKGLSGREKLDENSGMLFVFDSKDTIRSFWMKGMEIPLDFIWINDDKVIQIDENVPTPAEGTEDSKLPIYSTTGPIDYVLEVNAGFSSKNNINVGDSVDLSSISD
jgi:uncharacterized membrane protein (UPF0127 family)